MQDETTGEIIVLRTPYNYDRNKASDESGLHCPEPTKAQQQFKEETDINTIVERFGLTGQLPTDVRMPISGDFTGLSTYQDALNALNQARASFDTMPATVRARFNNDPAAFVAFCDDENNRDEARRLGLLVPEPAKPEPLEVRIAPDPAAPK